MGDAEIIPIGTRGRPGRGTGKQPSSAAPCATVGTTASRDGPAIQVPVHSDGLRNADSTHPAGPPVGVFP